MKRRLIAIISCALLVVFTAGISRGESIGSPLFSFSGESPIEMVAMASGFGSSDLDDYLRLVRKVDPYALITGCFWDWRSISIYRRAAGFHFGYDIAMPSGTPVPAGWSGNVVSIAPWTGDQWGISIATAGGYTITYGHLRPCVNVGDRVEVGNIVGTIVIDHVDIKMRDYAGNFIDFGKTRGLLPVDSRVAVKGLREYYLNPGVDTRVIMKSKLEEIARLKKVVSSLEDYLEIEQESYRESKNQLQNMEKLLQEDLICRKTLEEEKKKVEERERSTKVLEKRLTGQKNRLSSLQREVSGYGSKGNISFANDTPGEKVSRREKVKSCRKKIEEEKEKVEQYRRLFEEGAISRKELEEAEKSYKKAQLEAIFNEEEKE